MLSITPETDLFKLTKLSETKITNDLSFPLLFFVVVVENSCDKILG